MSKKSEATVWVAAAAIVTALVFVIRQPAGTANGGGVETNARGAEELDRVVVLTPPKGCDGVAWATPSVLLGEKGVITRLLKVVGDAAKSPLVAGLLAANPAVAEFLDPAKAEAKVREVLTKELGFDPSKFARIMFAFCRNDVVVFLHRDAVTKAGAEIVGSRKVGEFVVVAKSQPLLDDIVAWSESEKKVAHPVIAALREVRAVRKGFGGESFGVLASGGFKAQPRFRALFAAVERTSTGFRLQAGGSGEDADLATYELKAKDAIEKYRGMIERLPPQAAAGLALAGGVGKLKKMVDGLKIVREGGFLTGSLSLEVDDFATIGMLAAIAIPAFLKYIKRAKTAEASFNTKKMAAAARVYFEEERVDADGKIIEKTFPPTTEWTPAGSRCEKANRKFAPDPKAWETEAWRALKFSIDDPRYFSYQFVSAGVGAGASFTARARGDLSCDGRSTTVERVGRIGASGNVEGSDAVWEATDKAARDGGAAGRWTPPGNGGPTETAIVITERKQRNAAVGKLVRLEGVVENTKIATILGVDVDSFSPDLRGEKAVATGILRKLVVTRQEIDDRTAKFGQFAHRGAGSFYSLVDPVTGRLAQVKRP